MKTKDCRHFSGYKPCSKSSSCTQQCTEYSPVQKRVLVIGLGAMGAVLRATCILPALVRKHPGCEVHWLTEKISKPLLENNPLIDKIYGLEFDELLKLEAFQFDLVISIDKDHRSGGILNRLDFTEVVGFMVDKNSGSIVPANSEAHELWSLGLSNDLKFYQNKKPETQLMVEAFALGPWVRDPYVIRLLDQESQLAANRREQWSPNGFPVLGINTGCSPTIPYKKLGYENHKKLIRKIQKELPGVAVVLLGGPEDNEVNKKLAEELQVISSPCDQGLRDGLASVEACDLVISGDSLGMHMAIGLKKYVVAWFGPTCDHEIDLYARGEKILTQASCSPCWKRFCDRKSMCYDQVSHSEILSAVERGFSCISSLSKPHSWETFSSPSHS